MNNLTTVGIALLLAAAPALGQNNQPKDPRSREAPNKVITRTDPHDWTFQATVNLRVFSATDPKTSMPKKQAFDFTSAAIVFPLIGETASSMPKATNSVDKIDGQLKLNDQQVLESPTEVLRDYPAGTRLAKWSMLKWEGEEVEIQLRVLVTSFQTKYDEALANKLTWPQAWPAAAASALEPEYFIDQGFDGPYDMTPVKDLIKNWTDGQDPKKVLGPAQLAKFLAGEVMQHVQVSGNGLATNRTGELQGVNVQTPPVTAKSRRGSEVDMVSLLVAVYRQVGLPARTVVGWDVGNDDDKRFLSERGSSGLRVWAEFALVDPAQADPVWVPVDIVHMRKSSTRPPPLDRPWPFFGENKELDGTIPFAFQVFPPAKGVFSYGAPAFFGWMVTPKPPERVIQTLRFLAITTPKRAEDMKREDEKRRTR